MPVIIIDLGGEEDVVVVQDKEVEDTPPPPQIRRDLDLGLREVEQDERDRDSGRTDRENFFNS